jgi:hypothetical protein
MSIWGDEGEAMSFTLFLCGEANKPKERDG